MKKNMGITDRWIRVVVGLVLLTLFLILKSDWRWVGLIGIIPLGTAILGFCPLYALFGIRTNNHEDRKETR